ncbi:hypothetical protein K6119_04085 [Paracrocinitomix mangrovi]|uniref:hypothetical protein n=1 Tax=Paracrocinitomix mangrovi TaxID=2862509 RepID=UPI001C8DD191|nr:hypothetical protein [Paracrocinitomix mangrovi]UKN02692.1 hypothetical protein K6119_04085 [Paracrocinitomix mangrovi]
MNHTSTEVSPIISMDSLVGDWLKVKSDIYYAGDHVTGGVSDSSVLVFTNDSLWFGLFPRWFKFGVECTTNNDTIFYSKDNKPLARAKFINDTLVLSLLETNLHTVDSYVRTELDVEVKKLLIENRINWELFAFIWELNQPQNMPDVVCDMHVPEQLDLRTDNNSSIIYDQNVLLYLTPTDTIGFSFVSNSGNNLELLHHCSDMLGLHTLRYTKAN